MSSVKIAFLTAYYESKIWSYVNINTGGLYIIFIQILSELCNYALVCGLYTLMASSYLHFSTL